MFRITIDIRGFVYKLGTKPLTLGQVSYDCAPWIRYAYLATSKLMEYIVKYNLYTL